MEALMFKMKLVFLLFFSFSATAFARPSETLQLEEGADEELKPEIGKIMDTINIFQKHLEIIRNSRKEILDKIANSEDEVSEMLTRQPAVIKIKEVLKDAALNGKNVKKCREEFKHATQLVTLDLKNRLLKISSLNLKIFELSVIDISSKLDRIKRNIGRVQVQCDVGVSNCTTITELEDYLKRTEKNIARVRQIPSKIIKTAVKQVETDYLSKAIGTRFEDVDLCLRETN